MILLFTDFGAADLYVGQVKAALWAHGGAAVVIDLLHSAPDYGVVPSAHLLAALAQGFPAGSVCLGVVDPGVGSNREGVVVRADGNWYVGPDNGLFSVLAARAASVEVWRIVWRPERLSNSFHGRDLFAPIAARLERGDFPSAQLAGMGAVGVQLDAGDLAEVIYVDHYGNAMSGLRAGDVPRTARLIAAGVEVAYAPVFAAAPQGMPLWYENSLGLVEIAVNRGNAARQVGLDVGATLRVAG